MSSYHAPVVLPSSSDVSETTSLHYHPLKPIPLTTTNSCAKLPQMNNSNNEALSLRAQVASLKEIIKVLES